MKKIIVLGIDRELFIEKISFLYKEVQFYKLNDNIINRNTTIQAPYILESDAAIIIYDDERLIQKWYNKINYVCGPSQNIIFIENRKCTGTDIEEISSENPNFICNISDGIGLKNPIEYLLLKISKKNNETINN
jgi:hypothetical protein